MTWIKKSKKHEQKFQKLQQLPADKITTIGIYKVCFEEEFIVGEGSEGTCVYIGLSDDGNEVAVKRMLTHICGDLAENERKILTMIKMEQSKHIVRYRYCKSGNPFTFLVLELCEETLTDYVRAHNEEYLVSRAPIIIQEILTGLLDLHGNREQERILHRNLKPSNILVDVLGHMRLADFGISKKVEEGKPQKLICLKKIKLQNKGFRQWCIYVHVCVLYSITVCISIHVCVLYSITVCI